MQKGTYSFCNKCREHENCCCHNGKIDMPILLPSEVEKIRVDELKNIDDFAVKNTNNLYQMKRKNNNEKNACVFFNNQECSIYSKRPIDCKLYTFDFKEIEGEYWLIYYDDTTICQGLPKNIEEIKNYAHNVRPLLDMFLPYMSECSDPVSSKRLSSQHYVKLFTIKSIKEDENL